jgi:predicted CoA-binding protein
VNYMDIPSILENTHLWFVVGLGNNPVRPAFGVAKFLHDHGKQIVPIYPRAEMVHGEQGFATISQASEVWGPPDVVDLFVNSSRVGQLSDQGVEAGAKVIWMQLGVTDEAAAERARAAGLTVVMNKCPAIEWRNTLPSSLN